MTTVLARLGGLTRAWRFQPDTDSANPGSGDLTAQFAAQRG